MGLVIFDCDGVLVDSEVPSNRVLAEVLGELGVHLSLHETMDRFMGLSWASCLAQVQELLGHPPPPTFTEAYMTRRDAAFATLEAVPGVHAAVAAVQASGVATCVASSGEHEKMRMTLGRTGLWDAFDGRIFSATDVQRGKPAPDLFLHAAASMGHVPRACTVVEDAPPGVAGARAAGMRVLGFARLTAPERLAQADAVFADMAELPSLVAA